MRASRSAEPVRRIRPQGLSSAFLAAAVGAASCAGTQGAEPGIHCEPNPLRIDHDASGRIVVRLDAAAVGWHLSRVRVEPSTAVDLTASESADGASWTVAVRPRVDGPARSEDVFVVVRADVGIGANATTVSGRCVVAVRHTEVAAGALPPRDAPTPTPTSTSSPTPTPTPTSPATPTPTPTPTATPTPTLAPSTRSGGFTFRGFRIRFDDPLGTTFYELDIESESKEPLAFNWQIVPPRGQLACGRLTDHSGRFGSRNAWDHTGCDVDRIERFHFIEVHVFRPDDFQGSFGGNPIAQPGSQFALYRRNARAGDSPHTASWQVDEVFSVQVWSKP